MEHGSYPPAFLADKNGRPVHSWRVLILPYLDQRGLFAEYRFDEPWNGPNNRKLLHRMPDVYRCPSHGHHGEAASEYFTNYVALLSPEGVFRGSVPTREIKGDSSQTLLVADVDEQAVEWMAPDDLSAEEFVSLFANSVDTEEFLFNHSRGTNVILADGSREFLSVETPLERIRQLISCEP